MPNLNKHETRILADIMNPTNEPLFIIDHRELPSGIPDLLQEEGAAVEITSLRKGDYLIAKHFLAERKTKDDFVVSLIQGRLFTQCLNITESQYHPLLIIEGNPYLSTHNIKRSAIKGALLAVCTAWHIPIIFTHDRKDTAHTLMHLSLPNAATRNTPYPRGHTSKSPLRQQSLFLQGLPTVGCQTAKALIEKFDTIEQVINATTDELMQIEGIGHKKAKAIREFILRRYK